MYRICCPSCYKKKQRKIEEEEDRRKSIADLDHIRRPSRKSDGDHLQFSTIAQLTSATVVTEPPPVFAKFMLRKSVDRLNTEVRISFLYFTFLFYFIFNFSFVLSMNFVHDLKNLKIKNMTKLLRSVIVEAIFLKNNCERVRCNMFTLFFSFFFLLAFFSFFNFSSSYLRSLHCVKNAVRFHYQQITTKNKSSLFFLSFFFFSSFLFLIIFCILPMCGLSMLLSFCSAYIYIYIDMKRHLN